jgi:hypothetical protein
MNVRVSAVFVSLATASCGSSETPRPPTVGDCVGPGCTSTPVGTESGEGGPSADGSDAADDAASLGDASGLSVTVRVGLTTDDRFLAATFDDTEPVVVRAEGASGAVVSTPADGIVPPAVLGGVAAGRNWFSLGAPPSSKGRFLPTLEPVVVDVQAPSVDLVAVDRDELAQTAQVLLLPTLDLSAAQAILIFRRNEVPLAGVAVRGVPAGTTIAYDAASGYVADGGGKTGALGTVLLFDVAAAPPPPLTYDVGEGPVALELEVVPGFVTWARLDLP